MALIAGPIITQPPFVEPDRHDHFQPIFQHNHLCRGSLVGIVYAIDQEKGSTFWTGKSESGCFSPSTGAFSATETDDLVAGTGVFAGATGTTTYTVVGFVLGPPPATGALGFFEWFQIKGTNTLTLP